MGMTLVGGIQRIAKGEREPHGPSCVTCGAPVWASGARCRYCDPLSRHTRRREVSCWDPGLRALPRAVAERIGWSEGGDPCECGKCQECRLRGMVEKAKGAAHGTVLRGRSGCRCDACRVALRDRRKGLTVAPRGRPRRVAVRGGREVEWDSMAVPPGEDMGLRAGVIEGHLPAEPAEPSKLGSEAPSPAGSCVASRPPAADRLLGPHGSRTQVLAGCGCPECEPIRRLMVAERRARRGP